MKDKARESVRLSALSGSIFCTFKLERFNILVKKAISLHLNFGISGIKPSQFVTQHNRCTEKRTPVNVSPTIPKLFIVSSIGKQTSLHAAEASFYCHT